MTKILLYFAVYVLASGALATPRGVLSGRVDFKNIPLEPFYKGLYGKVGTSTFFVASKKTLPDKTKQYWAIVQVLSKKYGCLIKRKKSHKAYTAFLCQDKRIVVFHSRNKEGHVVISGRQFDKDGRELVVKNRKIIARYPVFRRSLPKNKVRTGHYRKKYDLKR